MVTDRRPRRWTQWPLTRQRDCRTGGGRRGRPLAWPSSGRAWPPDPTQPVPPRAAQQMRAMPTSPRVHKPRVPVSGSPIVAVSCSDQPPCLLSEQELTHGVRAVATGVSSGSTSDSGGPALPTQPVVAILGWWASSCPVQRSASQSCSKCQVWVECLQTQQHCVEQRPH